MGIIGEKAFAYSVWETYANETEGIYFSLQESIKITGVVKDNKGEPIIGANIVELNKKGNGTITDIDGKFTLSVSKNAEISISFIGFDEKKIKIGQQTSFDIILEESSQFLDEVVVVGMNNRQTRRSVTGAISTIQTKELKQSPVANLSNALAGKLPGLITVQTSGQPGEDASSLFIRGVGTYGTSNPLVVIDGLPRSQTDFNQLDANEIESVTILKDASSSSLYGIQGANGVIVVTTKRGAVGRSYINIQASYGLSEAPGNRLKMMNTKEKIAFERGIYEDFPGLNIGGRVYQLLKDVDNGKISKVEADAEIDRLSKINTNWFDEIFRVAQTQNYSISLSGGDERTQYYGSLSYLSQEGVMPNNKYESMGASIKLTHDFNRFLRVHFDVRSTLRNDRSSASPVNPLDYATYANPYERPYDDNGNYVYDRSSYSTKSSIKDGMILIF